MKTLSLIYSIASAAALAISPVSVELSASLVVLVGVVALMAGDYSREIGMQGAKA